MTSTSKKQPDLELYLQLHRTLSTLLMKNRFIRKLTHTGLSRAEVHALIEIHARGESTIKSLQPLLNMDQSSVSRLIKNLIEEKRVYASLSSEDKRVKLLRLSSGGLNAISQIDEVAGSIFEGFRSKLTKNQGEELLEFFKDVANWYGQPACPTRAGENEIRMQQRRMSRALGVLSKDAFGSGFSFSQWNILSEICDSTYPLNPKQLSESQDIPGNSLSIALDKLEKLGFIERTQAKHDSRFIEIYPSSSGKTFRNKIVTQSALDLQKILGGYSQKEQTKLLEIMLRYTDQAHESTSNLMSDALLVKKIKTKKDRKSARTFSITELVKRGHAEFSPSFLIADHSLVYGLFDKNKHLQSVCEIVHNSDPAELTLLASNKQTPPGLAFTFMEQIIELLRADSKTKRLRICFEPAVTLLKNGGRLKSGRDIYLH